MEQVRRSNNSCNVEESVVLFSLFDVLVLMIVCFSSASFRPCSVSSTDTGEGSGNTTAK